MPSGMIGWKRQEMEEDLERQGYRRKLIIGLDLESSLRSKFLESQNLLYVLPDGRVIYIDDDQYGWVKSACTGSFDQEFKNVRDNVRFINVVRE